MLQFKKLEDYKTAALEIEIAEKLKDDQAIPVYPALDSYRAPFDREKILPPFHMRELIMFTKLDAAQAIPGKRYEKLYRPFSCRIRSKNGYHEWRVDTITVYGVTMPPRDNAEDIPMVLQYMDAERFSDIQESRDIRQSLIERIEDIESLYELQKLAEHMERFAF